MSAAGTALRVFALQDSGITDLIGDRIRPAHLEQGDEEESVVATYQTISATPDEALTEDVNHTTERMQYDVYSNDEDLAENVAGKLRKRIRQAHGQVDTETDTFITGCSTASGVRDLSAMAPIDGSTIWKHRLSFDMMVSYNPPA